jgi:hypothetical protein
VPYNQVEMELSELQISIAALFLLSAVAILVLCNALRNKTQNRAQNRVPNRERKPQIRVVEPPWQSFELPAKQAGGSFAAEIAALATLGMQEENSAWKKISPDTDSYAQHPEPVQSSKELSYNGPRGEVVSDPDGGAHRALGASQALQLQPVTVDEFLFDLLVSGRTIKDSATSRAEGMPALEARFEVIPAPTGAATPHGMIDERTLRKIVAIGKPFTGVAVVISLNEDEGVRRSEGQLEWVSAYIAGLLNEHEFACRTDKEEFLIVCPGTQGAEAQRRLNDVSERLWDFQLRGIGTYAIRFSWGGVEVQNQPLADAIDSATERMRLTKRIRNPIYLNSVNVRRKVV